MEKNYRMQHIRFIEADTKQRGETITSDICFIGALYQVSVKKEGDKKIKSIMYSAAEKVMKGYRAIN